MMIAFFDVVFDVNLDPKLLLPEKKSLRSGD
jgi:hypothetical protein